MSEWQPISERPELDNQPGRQFVLVKGHRTHSRVPWLRIYAGIAFIRKPGSVDEIQQYRAADIRQIEKDGGMDYGSGVVTHWMPAKFPAYPDK